MNSWKSVSSSARRTSSGCARTRGAETGAQAVTRHGSSLFSPVFPYSFDESGRSRRQRIKALGRPFTCPERWARASPPAAGASAGAVWEQERR